MGPCHEAYFHMGTDFELVVCEWLCLVCFSSLPSVSPSRMSHPYQHFSMLQLSTLLYDTILTLYRWNCSLPPNKSAYNPAVTNASCPPDNVTILSCIQSQIRRSGNQAGLQSHRTRPVSRLTTEGSCHNSHTQHFSSLTAN